MKYFLFLLSAIWVLHAEVMELTFSKQIDAEKEIAKEAALENKKYDDFLDGLVTNGLSLQAYMEEKLLLEDHMIWSYKNKTPNDETNSTLLKSTIRRFSLMSPNHPDKAMLFIVFDVQGMHHGKKIGCGFFGKSVKKDFENIVINEHKTKDFFSKYKFLHSGKKIAISAFFHANDVRGKLFYKEINPEESEKEVADFMNEHAEEIDSSEFIALGMVDANTGKKIMHTLNETFVQYPFLYVLNLTRAYTTIKNEQYCTYKGGVE